MVPLQDNRSGTDRGRQAAFAHGVPGIFVQACFYPGRLASAVPVPAAAGEEQRPVPRRQGTGTPPGRCLLAAVFAFSAILPKKSQKILSANILWIWLVLSATTGIIFGKGAEFSCRFWLFCGIGRTLFYVGTAKMCLQLAQSVV